MAFEWRNLFSKRVRFLPFQLKLTCEGEYVVTFSKVFHTGFNAGYNAAEAIDFATTSWARRFIESK
jgi:hypothetical protein